jgi:hypothetical protein
MGTEMVSETPVTFNHLTLLIALEYFVNFKCRKASDLKGLVIIQVNC